MSIAVSYGEEDMVRLMFDFYLKSRIVKVNNNNRNLAEYISKMKDLYIGLPMLFVFLFLFSFTSHKLISIIYLTVCIFLLLPVKVSKKNRMYKVVILLVKYIFKCKNYYYIRNGEDIDWKEKLTMKKI